jgi:hypothetical protein
MPGQQLHSDAMPIPTSNKAPAPCSATPAANGIARHDHRTGERTEQEARSESRRSPITPCDGTETGTRQIPSRHQAERQPRSSGCGE